MSGHRCEASLKTYNCYLSDAQKRSVHVCRMLQTLIKTTIAKSPTFRAAHPQCQSPQHELHLPLSLSLLFHEKKSKGTRQKCHPMTLPAILRSARPCLQKFSPIPSLITVLSTLTSNGWPNYFNRSSDVPRYSQPLFTEWTLLIFLNVHLLLKNWIVFTKYCWIYSYCWLYVWQPIDLFFLWRYFKQSDFLGQHRKRSLKQC